MAGQEKFFSLPMSVYIANPLPVDGGRYLAKTIAERDAIITDGRAFDGLQVYVEAENKLYILIDKTVPTWNELASSDSAGDGFVRKVGDMMTGNLVMAKGSDIIFPFDPGAPGGYSQISFGDLNVDSPENIHIKPRVVPLPGPPGSGNVGMKGFEINTTMAGKDPEEDDHFVTKRFLNASVFVEELTHAELKALRDAGNLTTGKFYILSDFKTIYEQPESLVVSNSTEGIAAGLDTTVEKLLLRAVSTTGFDKVAVSLDRPKDIIHYSLDLDMTGGKVTDHKGGIYYRKDIVIDVEMRYDWRTVKFRRYALTADAWDGTTAYKKWDTCRVGDRLFVALEDNTNQEPVATDGASWMTVFHDLTSRPDLEYNTAQSKTPADTDTRMKTYGFKVDATKFKDYYTFAFLDEPDNSTGIHVGTGRSVYGISFMNNVSVDSNGLPNYWDLIANNIIMLENKGSILASVANIRIHDVDHFYWNTFRPYSYMYDLTVEGVGKMENLYLSGFIYKSTVRAPHFEESLVRGLSYTTVIGDGINGSVINLQKDDLDEGRLVNAGSYTIIKGLVYLKKWLHGIGRGMFTDCVFSRDAEITNSYSLELYNSHIYGNIRSTSFISDSGYFRVGNGVGKNITINGSAKNCVFVDAFNLTVDGNLDGVEMRQVKDVTIPANITLTEVKFDIPLWQGKNTWSGDPLTLVNTKVSRKWEDVPGAATQEKLWYEEVDQNGTLTYKELK